MPSFQTFKDLSITFKKHPVSDDIVSVKDKAAIVQSISSLLLTNKGERPFQPELGADIRRVLFQPLDYASGALLKSSIVDCIRRYEPRIRLDDVIASPNFEDNGFDVEIFFTIIGRDDRVVAAQFFLERTR